MNVIAQQDDTIDALCWRHLGMTRVLLPQPKSEAKTTQTMALWD